MEDYRNIYRRIEMVMAAIQETTRFAPISPLNQSPVPLLRDLDVYIKTSRPVKLQLHKSNARLTDELEKLRAVVNTKDEEITQLRYLLSVKLEGYGNAKSEETLEGDGNAEGGGISGHKKNVEVNESVVGDGVLVDTLSLDI
ncbi:hypothetical protein S40288_10781 [Stachybotrys chartarum IBT 40288]|nr:hypothetical protein S40288_10781 [Stachybotrys chartarum IBT 40288]